jgi:hypothetical protein
MPRLTRHFFAARSRDFFDGNEDRLTLEKLAQSA